MGFFEDPLIKKLSINSYFFIDNNSLGSNSNNLHYELTTNFTSINKVN